MDLQCPMCGSLAVKGSCDGCKMWFCTEHLYRHRQCSHGR